MLEVDFFYRSWFCSQVFLEWINKRNILKVWLSVRYLLIVMSNLIASRTSVKMLDCCENWFFFCDETREKEAHYQKNKKQKNTKKKKKKHKKHWA